MESKLPDEFFRRRSEPEAREPVTEEPTGAPKPRVPGERPRMVMVPMRIAAVLVFGALLLGFLLGRVLLDRPGIVVQPSPSPIIEPSPSPSPSEAGLIYQGPTVPVRPLQGTTTCSGAGALEVPRQEQGTTSWRCSGSGVGERIVLTFRQGQQIVGVRLVGGNNANLQRFNAERRILSVRWSFSDGSFFEQGLPSNSATPQEVAFPLVEADFVEMEILLSTPPGNSDIAEDDVVTISALEFLAPA